MNSQLLPRASLIQWVNQCFPYLVYDYLTPQEFSDYDLNTFYTLCCYQMQQGEEITKRLAERNLLIQKRQEENMNKPVKGHYKNQDNYYSQSNYYAANYPYDPNYYAGYTGYDPNTNATQQQQGYDYNNNGYAPQEYYQNQNQRGYNNNYQKGGKNQNYNQGGYDQKNSQGGYNQQQYYQGNDYQQYQEVPQQSAAQNQSQSLLTSGAIEIPQTSEIVTPPVPPTETKEEVTEKSPIASKNLQKQTAPSTPAPVPTEVEVQKVREPVKLSFAEWKKNILDFKDYSRVSAAFKNKIQDINKREPTYEDIKINDRYKKGPKNNINSIYQSQALSQAKPAQAGSLARSTHIPKPASQTSSSFKVEIIRKVQNEQERQFKKHLADKAKNGGSVIDGSKREISNFEKAEKEIKFNLNLITLENFTAIKNDLTKYVTNEEKQCEKLINNMIEKAWIEPKFATIYAKLSSEFGKLNNFKWGEKKSQGESKKKGSNPFKTVLIKVVQEVFEDDFTQKPKGETEKLETIQEENESEEVKKETIEEELDTKTLKKKIIGNVRFIGELLLEKVLSKKIVFYCIGHLIECFFKHYAIAHEKNHNELAEIYFQSLIELIEKVGDKFESTEDKFSNEEFNVLLKKIEQASANATLLPLLNAEQWLITSERFFDIFDAIDKQVLMKKYPRISALLKNLTERKNDNWISHVVENKGPMTLNQVRREEDEREEERNRIKKDTFDYEKQWVKIFSKYDKGKYLKQDTIDEYVEYSDNNAKDDLKKFFRQDVYEIISAYVRIFADGPKPIVERRVKLFELILIDLGFVKYDHLRQAWLKNAGKLCYSDFPLAALYFPKIMAMMNAQPKYPIHVSDWEITNPDDEEETEYSALVIANYKKAIAK